MCVCVVCLCVSMFDVCVCGVSLCECVWCVWYICVCIHVFCVCVCVLWCVYVRLCVCVWYMYVGVVWMCVYLCINTCTSTPYWAYQFLSKCYLHLIFLVRCMYVYLCVVQACEYSWPQRSEILLNLELLKVVNHPNYETNSDYLEKQETLLSHFF